MNNVNLIGRLTKDPEVRYGSESGNAVAVYTLAVNRQFKKPGEPEADFIRCKCFAKTAEFAQKYLHKGDQVGVHGRIQITNYTDTQGNMKSLFEIIVDNHTFCGSKGAANQEAGATSSPGGTTFAYTPPLEDDDDLPF